MKSLTRFAHCVPLPERRREEKRRLGFLCDSLRGWVLRSGLTCSRAPEHEKDGDLVMIERRTCRRLSSRLSNRRALRRRAPLRTLVVVRSIQMKRVRDLVNNARHPSVYSSRSIHKKLKNPNPNPNPNPNLQRIKSNLQSNQIDSGFNVCSFKGLGWRGGTSGLSSWRGCWDAGWVLDRWLMRR